MCGSKLLLPFIVCLIIAGCTNSGQTSTPALKMPDFEKIFGQQIHPKSPADFRLEAWVQELISHYSITVKVIKGKNLSFENSTNLVVTYQDGMIKRINKPIIDSDGLYVYAHMKLVSQYGSRIYRCSLIIRDGPLKGATVHLCDNACPESITDAYQAYYLLPKEMVMSEGELKYTIIRFWGK